MNFKVLKMYAVVLTSILLLSFGFVLLEKQNYVITIDDRASLSEKSLHLLKQLTGKKSVKFMVFSREGSVVSNKIKKFFSPFKQVNDSLLVEFVDPSKNPSQMKKNSITMQGEMVLSFQDDSQLKKINITELSESAISNGLLRLQNQSDQWLVFAERFGMKTIGDDSKLGLSNLLIHLKKSGFNIARMPLNNSVVLPDNVKLLVLAGPIETLNSQMVDYLINMMEGGVSVLWLNDTTSNQTNLELALGVFFGDKASISDENGGNYLSKFPNHAITENFNQPVFIAEAKEVILDEGDAFITSENNKSIAVAAQLLHSRLIIVGDSDFISNQYLNIAANKSLIDRMVDWLLYHDERINIPVQINKSTQLILSESQLIALSVIFLLFIPLLLLSIAIFVWRKNCAQS